MDEPTIVPTDETGRKLVFRAYSIVCPVCATRAGYRCKNLFWEANEMHAARVALAALLPDEVS